MVSERARRQLALRAFCAAGLALPFVFLVAPLARVESFGYAFQLVTTLTAGEWDDLAGAATRTVLLAVATALGAALLGLTAGLTAMNGGAGLSRHVQVLLVLPFFLGQTVEAFVIRHAFSMGWQTVHTTDWPGVAVLGLIAVIQVLRFGGLFAVVFAAVLQAGKRAGTDFFVTHGVGRRLLVRDVFVPRVETTFQLCCCMAFVAAMVEDAMAALVFRASPGNQLELLSQWGARQYSTMSLSDPGAARDFISLFSSLQFGFTLLLGVLLFIGARPVAGMCTVLRRHSAGGALKPARRETAALWAVLTFAAVHTGSVVWIAALHRADLGVEFAQDFGGFSLTLALGMLTAMLATGLAAVLAVACSLAWPTRFARPSPIAVGVLVLALLLSAVPFCYLVLAAHDWALAVLRTHAGEPAWIVSHAAVLLPLLFAFFVVSHFEVRPEEIELQLLHCVPLRQILIASYGRRFMKTYALGALCAFALIWNEHAINMAFNDAVPSFAAELQRAMQGRAANAGRAAMCAVFSLLVGLTLAVGLSNPLRRRTLLASAIR